MGTASGWFEPAILHVDMDAFFASVEVLDRPELAGRPVVVGGSGARGVVASCTYEARAYGVRSAMPTVRARQLCPDAVFLDGRYWRYAEVSGRLRQILLEVTPLVEPIGLDEAFLDVSGAARRFDSPVTVAHHLRRSVGQELSLRCSVGIGRSKLIAKLASRAAKPAVRRPGAPRPTLPEGGGGSSPGTGVLLVHPDEELSFLHPLPVGSVWGVGPATGQRLAGLGIRTIGDLARLPEAVLVRRLGQAQGRHLAALARADDSDPVVPDRPAKSVGHEETFAEDVVGTEGLRAHLRRMVDAVAAHLVHQGMVGRTVTVKVRFADFKTLTRSHTLPFPLDTAPALGAVAEALLDAVVLPSGVRLLGVSVSGLGAAPAIRGEGQLAFDLGPAAQSADQPVPDGVGAGSLGERARSLQASWAGVAAALEAIRTRYGTSAVGTAAMVGSGGLDVPTRRRAPWGPGAPQGPSPRAPGSLSGHGQLQAGADRPPGEGRPRPPGRRVTGRPEGDGEGRP